MKKSIKENAKDYFGQQQLEQEQLDALAQLLEKKNLAPKKHFRTRAGLAVAASLLLTALALPMLWKKPAATQEEMAFAIAAEVAKEHREQDPLEIVSDQLSAIQAGLGELAFAPISSRMMDQNRLLGGRYCSIRKIPAAQMRYQHNNQPLSLYQVPYTPEQFGHIPDMDQGETPLIVETAGVTITLWVEQGLLSVSAHDTLPPAP